MPKNGFTFRPNMSLDSLVSYTSCEIRMYVFPQVKTADPFLPPFLQALTFVSVTNRGKSNSLLILTSSQMTLILGSEPKFWSHWPSVGICNFHHLFRLHFLQQISQRVPRQRRPFRASVSPPDCRNRTNGG